MSRSKLRPRRGERNAEVRDQLVETIQELANDWLDDRAFVVFARERLDGLDRFPGRGHDNFSFVPALSGHHLDLHEAIDRAEMGEDRVGKVLAAVAIDPGLRPVPS